MKNKKAALESEPIIIWIIVILVILLALFFIFKTRIDLWIKNLPSYQQKEGEDIEIVPDETEVKVYCKYQIGKVTYESKYKKMWLVRPYDLKERDFSEILQNKIKMDENFYLFIKKDDKSIIYIKKATIWSSVEKVADIIDIYDSDGKKTLWKRIKLTENAKYFAFNKNASKLGKIEIPANLYNLKNDLALLHESKYHPSTGLLCKDSIH